MAMPWWVNCFSLTIYVSLLIFSLLKIPTYFKYRRKWITLQNQQFDQLAIENKLENDYISIEMIIILVVMSLFGSITFGAKLIL